MTALNTTCPRCEAAPGTECKSPSGTRPRGGLHMVRVNADRRQKGLIK